MTDRAGWIEVKCDPAIVPGGCGDVAILVRRKQWTTGEAITVSNLRWPDGRTCTVGEPTRCHACKRQYAGNAFMHIVKAALEGAGLFHSVPLASAGEKTPVVLPQP